MICRFTTYRNIISLCKNNEANGNQILIENSKKNNVALYFCSNISCYKISKQNCKVKIAEIISFCDIPARDTLV